MKELFVDESPIAAADSKIESLTPSSTFSTIASILRKIRALEEAEPFNAPVDYVNLGLFDYLDHISKPMDLGTGLYHKRCLCTLYMCARRTHLLIIMMFSARES